MPITSHSQDILSEISYHPSIVTEHTAIKQATSKEQAAALLNDISRCVAILGPIQICYDINLNTPKATISLKVTGITVISGEISPEHPCLKFEGDYSVAKWDLNICLRIPTKSITLEGKACVTFLGCKEFDIALFHWGQQIALETSTPITSKDVLSQHMEAKTGGSSIKFKDIVNQHMEAETGGSFLVKNEGGYVAWFQVTYTFQGLPFSKDSGDFPVGQSRSVEIPAGATGINLKVEEYVFFGCRSTIFSIPFNQPVRMCYKIWGTTLLPAWENVSC